MTHDHGSGVGTDGSIDWDAMYAASEQVWSGNPNGVLVAEVSDLTPGTAVDVGCGEGADAIWLARRGWEVSAFDVSETALHRAAEHIAAAGVSVQLHHGGLLDVTLPSASYDLVNVQYPGLRHEQGRSLTALLDLVAPGGTLLFVHHVDVGFDHTQEGGFNPADYLMPPDVHVVLGADWEVEVYGTRPRHVTTGAGAGHTEDRVLRARRLVDS